ncbi:hypothetical protein M9H77_06510 [Catharanthus roseus]|uniref:Uncharacterized protein n=1 Tax=Catharanthus roseus TaxID=4058 RepID=A0ACC0BS99_CATRO|nr:hypothetical protein M9H77_06510 [Catharanthus roseus]
MDCGTSGMTRSIRPSVSSPKRTGLMDEARKAQASIGRVLAHSLRGKLQSVDCSGLTSLATSFTKTFMFIKKGIRKRDKFCKHKEQKEHERRTIGASMPELNEGLKEGHGYGFSAAESAHLHAQSQHSAVGGRPFLCGYEEHMATISR